MVVKTVVRGKEGINTKKRHKHHTGNLKAFSEKTTDQTTIHRRKQRI
jgi:hypothetical protein